MKSLINADSDLVDYARAHIPVRTRAMTCIAWSCVVIAGSTAIALMGAVASSASTSTAPAIADHAATPADGTASEHASSADGHTTRAERARQRAIARRRAHAHVASAQQARDEAQATVDRLQSQQDRAAEALTRAIATLEDHLVAMYKRGDTVGMQQLIAARDVAGMVDSVDMMRTIAAHDRNVIAEYQQAVDELELLDSRAAVAQDSLVASNVALDAAQSDLAALTGPPRRTGPGGADDPIVLRPSDYYSSSFGSSLAGLTGSQGLDSLGGLSGWTGTLPDANSELPDGQHLGTVSERGVASWYGPGFHGKTTANGETYDQFAMTAAHPTLPFGTWVRVTAVATGSHVDVRINDRGPYVEGRIIDLSWAAAQQIGMDGTADVTIQPYRADGSQ